MEFFKQNALLNEMRVSSALKMRKIHLSDEIERDVIFEAEYLLGKIVKIDKITNTKQPITIEINSYGGCCYNGLSLISKICQLKDEGYHIITTVSGVAMSMGAMILLAGSERRAYRYSTILFHQPSSATWGTLRDMQDDVDETNRLWELMKTIIKENSNIKEEELNDMYEYKRDWIITPEEALELGVIDKIL